MNHSIDKQRVLIVDDTPDNVMILTYLLRTDYDVISATNGEEALLLVREPPLPDLILLDVMMPELDGFEVCRRLKGDPLTREIPVVFVTALGEVSDETKGFRAGAVDYITKPFSLPVVRARVKTHLALRAAYRDINDQHALLAAERELIEGILLKMRAAGQFDGAGLRFLLTPVERTAGDILLSARRPDGVRHVLLGDFTGHGLAAAIAGPLLEDIFHTMTAKGLPLEEILPEVNLKLYRKLPVNVYLAAVFLEWDPRSRRLRVFNGGMPEVLLFREKRWWRSLPSLHYPLGVTPLCQLEEAVEEVETRPGDLAFALSDGIVETQDPGGDQFGVQRLVTMLEAILVDGLPLEDLLLVLEAHRDGAEQSDDITMVELACP